ncbi:MAG: DMT family transporter [Planctomycetaceae bacterium]
MEARNAARLRVLGAAALFSTGGAAIKACDLTGWQVASFRSGFAALAILLFVPAARRGWSRRTLLVSVGYAATLTLFVLANKLTTSASTIFLQSTAPVYLLLLSPRLLREPIARPDVVLLAVLAAAMGMVFVGGEVASATAPDPALGNLLAAGSGFSWAFTVLGLRWLARSDEGAARTAAGAAAAGNLLAFAICLPFALPMEAPRLLDWTLLVYLGAFQIGLAYVLLTGGMRWVPALEGSLLLLFEPALNPIWAWLVHGERPGPWVLAGGATILLATAVHASRSR